MLSPARKLLKRFHPEGIPWPGTVLYNVASGTDIFQRHYELLAEDILEHCPRGRLLDIGTGPGWLLVKLHERNPNLHLTGVDVSPSMVARAQRNMDDLDLSDAIDIREGDASRLPYPADSFDAVVSTGSLHHWTDPTECLTEVYRVLKPDSHALMYDIVSDTPSSVLRQSAREFGRLKILLLWLHAFTEPFYSREQYATLAEATPFGEGDSRFVGVMCCLHLLRGPTSPPHSEPRA